MLSRQLASRFVRNFSRNFQQQAPRGVFHLSGVFPTVVTPFAKDEAIDFGRYNIMLHHLNRYPVAGFALLGSAGEFASLDYEKKLELVSHARETLGDHRIIIVGAGLESTSDTINLVGRMAKNGADAAFVYNPTYFRERMDDAAYLEHFTKVADASPIPIILYNIPTHLDVDIPVDVVVELAKHPKIIGTLDTGGNVTRLAQICYRTKNISCKRSNPFSVIAGSACFFLPALSVGATGAICSLANVLPFELCLLEDLYREGRLAEARELQWRLLAPNEAVTTKYGVAGLKSILRSYIGIDTGSVRSPLRDLTPAEDKAVYQIFKTSGFIKEKKKDERVVSTN